MPGYRQRRTKKTKKKKGIKTKRPYASVKMKSSALGKAKSTPTKSKSTPDIISKIGNKKSLIINLLFRKLNL